MRAFRKTAIAAALVFGQSSPAIPLTRAELLQVFNCTLEGCADWDSYKRLDTFNVRVEFTQNRKLYVLFAFKSSAEDRSGRVGFELRPAGASDIQSLESFGCSLDGTVPFKDSPSPYGFRGKRPGFLIPPYFRSPDGPAYWQNRFNQAIADTLAFIASHPKRKYSPVRVVRTFDEGAI